uniref:Uncharacterized protein n=1 Tax=Marseillevirus LCMAC102 TaxID=2506603 RepID=A0A481YUN7_9VIRU|nr:MAG: hypothetical protein LCMAC102_00390 [Marseillevirus LCMAC102]
MEILEKLRDPSKLKISPMKGVGSRGNAYFMSSDIAVQYLWYVIDEKNRAGAKLGLTEGVMLIDNSDNMVRKACKLLTERYEDILEQYPFTEGIYTVMNASPYLGGEAHQNWVLYRPQENIFIRFEPNGSKFDKDPDMKRSYKFFDLMNCLSNKLGATWSYATDFSINYFSGCRATSTILALLTLMDIDLDNLRQVEKYDLEPLALAVSNSVMEQECKLPQLPRAKGRRMQKEALQSYVVPVGTTTTPPPDFSQMNATKLRNYLKSQHISFTSREPKNSLIAKANASLNVILVP